MPLVFLDNGAGHLWEQESEYRFRPAPLTARPGQQPGGHRTGYAALTVKPDLSKRKYQDAARHLQRRLDVKEEKERFLDGLKPGHPGLRFILVTEFDGILPGAAAARYWTTQMQSARDRQAEYIALLGEQGITAARGYENGQGGIYLPLDEAGKLLAVLNREDRP